MARNYRKAEFSHWEAPQTQRDPREEQNALFTGPHERFWIGGGRASFG